MCGREKGLEIWRVRRWFMYPIEGATLRLHVTGPLRGARLLQRERSCSSLCRLDETLG